MPFIRCISDVRLIGGDPEICKLCDDNGVFVRAYVIDGESGVLNIFDFDIDGDPYVTVGTVVDCASSASSVDVEQRLFCDDNAGVITPYIVAYEYDDAGNIIGTTITLIDGVTPYVPTGIARVCAGEDGDVEVLELCDDNGAFLRNIVYDNTGTILGTNDTLLDGTTPYVVVGTVVDCRRQLSISPLNLTSNLAGNDQRIAITGTQNTYAGFGGTLHADTTHVHVRYEFSAIRQTVTGTVPVAGYGAVPVGVLYLPNDARLWDRQTLINSRFVANTSVTGYLQVQEFKVI